jgi:hypothetical protein
MSTIQFIQFTPAELVNLITEGVKNQLCELVNNSTPKQEQQEPEFLTRKETADLLKVSLVTIHDWSNNKILKPYKMGNRTYFKRSEILQQLFNSNSVAR